MSATTTSGVLLLCNFGDRDYLDVPGLAPRPGAGRRAPHGSCIAVCATDAPLSAQQLRRLALRPLLGLARIGSYGAEGSGEIGVAFSTSTAQDLPTGDLDRLLRRRLRGRPRVGLQLPGRGAPGRAASTAACRRASRSRRSPSGTRRRHAAAFYRGSHERGPLRSCGCVAWRPASDAAERGPPEEPGGRGPRGPRGRTPGRSARRPPGSRSASRLPPRTRAGTPSASSRPRSRSGTDGRAGDSAASPARVLRPSPVPSDRPARERPRVSPEPPPALAAEPVGAARG